MATILPLRRLSGSEGGTTAVEFALVLPILLLTTLGTIEMAISLFIGSSIESAVIEASRYGTTGTTENGVSRGDRVLDIVDERTYGLLDMAQVKLDTLVYSTFDDVGKPEPWTDKNNNGAWDSGEPYTDVNGNAKWDADMGKVGLGGPGDIVLYRVSYDWGVVTPMMAELVGKNMHHVSAIAVRNEPWAGAAS